MNYLSVEGLSKAFGIHSIFQDLTFGIDKGDKVAFVAKNGGGKTTLLKILAGDGEEDEGRIVYRKGITVEYLDQEENLTSDFSIYEEVLKTETDEIKAIKRYQKSLENPEDQDEYEKAFEQMNITNAWDYEVRVNTVLSQLKLEDKDKPISELSGGEKKRVALAKVLINAPDIMILDEPTNHLDLDMIEWLEEFLSRAQTTIIMVTHDRYFLEVICNTIFELEDQTIYKYEGNFSYYLEQKAKRQEILKATIGKAKNLMKTELEWIRRQPKARGTKAKARVDAFQDLKAVATQKVRKDEMEIRIMMNRLGSKIVELHKVGKSYGELKLINDFSYVFKRGEKVGIVGANGSGKSTILNMITGSVEPSKGKIIVGDTVVMAYYHQDGMQFRGDQKVIEIIRDIADFIPMTKGKKLSAAQLLERFLFPRDMHFNFVEKLSGGEKKRLYLLTILMENPNFLILDEPTNDLDIFTLGVLEDYLLEFEGCLLIVSHDRYFIDKLVDHTFYLRGDGEIKDIIGNYTTYRDYLIDESKSVKNEQKKSDGQLPDGRQAAKAGKQTRREKTKLSYKEKQEFDSLEGDIEALTKQRLEITDLLNSGSLNSDKANEMAIRLSEISVEIDFKESRWLELSEYEG